MGLGRSCWKGRGKLLTEVSVRNFVTEMSLSSSMNLVTVMSLASRKVPMERSRNFVTEMSLSSRYLGSTVSKNSMMVIS